MKKLILISLLACTSVQANQVPNFQQQSMQAMQNGILLSQALRNAQAAQLQQQALIRQANSIDIANENQRLRNELLRMKLAAAKQKLNKVQ